MERLLQVEGADAAIWIVAAAATGRMTRSEPPAVARAVLAAEAWKPPAAFEPVDLTELLALGPAGRPFAWMERRRGPALREARRARLENLGLDFVLDLSVGGDAGRLPAVCSSGVWAFRHGNPNGSEGGPMGFREIMITRR